MQRLVRGRGNAGTGRRVRRPLGVTGVALTFLLIGAGSVAADDYEDDDISLRMASAFIRFTEVSAFGGETVANRWSSAINPASADWTKLPQCRGLLVAPYWSRLNFDSGMELDIYGEAGAWDTRRAGTFVPTVSQLRSNDVPDRTGLGFDYETDTLQLMWGKRCGCWAVGAMANYNESTVIQRAGAVEVRRSEAETWRFRVGGLYEPRCKWMLGLVAEYGWSPYTYEALFPTPVGPVPISGDDTLRQHILRGGVSYEYKPLCSAFLDYQYASFESDAGTLSVHRVQGGVQHRVAEFLWLRGGLSTDHFGNVGGLVGLSAAFARWGQVHFGYQHNMHPDLVTDFGDAEVFQLTLRLDF